MRVTYTLKLESEYHIGTGLSKPGVADSALLTRPDGTLVVPAEHLRGILRDACTEALYWLGREDECCEASLKKGPSDRVLATCGLNADLPVQPCVLCRLFGTTFTPRQYQFFDALPAKCIKKTRVSPHNRVDPATGRVPEETFFSFELGEACEFTGCIERNGPQIQPELLKDELGLLLSGLRLVERVGGKSARGWGHCRVEVTHLQLDDRDGIPLDIETKTDVDAWLRTWVGVETEGEQ